MNKLRRRAIAKAKGHVYKSTKNGFTIKYCGGGSIEYDYKINDLNSVIAIIAFR